MGHFRDSYAATKGALIRSPRRRERAVQRRHVRSNRACIVRSPWAHNLTILSRGHYTDFRLGFHCHCLVMVEKPIVACKSHDLKAKSLRVQIGIEHTQRLWPCSSIMILTKPTTLSPCPKTSAGRRDG